MRLLRAQSENKRNIYCGMMACLDEGIGNLTSTPCPGLGTEDREDTLCFGTRIHVHPAPGYSSTGFTPPLLSARLYGALCRLYGPDTSTWAEYRNRAIHYLWE